MKSQPETGLWTAVLCRAILDLSIPEEQARATAWIKSSEEHPGSFQFVAEVLNQNPKELRRRIFLWRAEKGRTFQDAA
ncbi:MAG: hypothetical protein H7835_17560 [Magnetococcus sp. XQGC-1]